MARLPSLLLCAALVCFCQSSQNCIFDIPRLPYFPCVLVFGCVLIHIHSSTCKSHSRAALSLNHLRSQAGQVAVAACEVCFVSEEETASTTDRARARVRRGGSWTAVMRCITTFALCFPPFFSPQSHFHPSVKRMLKPSRGGRMR